MSEFSAAGTGFLALALAAVLGTAASAAWAARSGRRRWRRVASYSALSAAVLLGAAVLVLAAAFLADRVELRAVAAHSSRSLPVWLKVTALWAGQEGSLLLWSFLQALLASVATGGRAARGEPRALYILCILSVIAAFYTALTLFGSNPFTPSNEVPAEGAGLSPLLRHPAMAFHPPAMYLGYVGLAVPYACAVSALITGDAGDWIALARRWTLAAWVCLGLGLLLGSRWAYVVLGWGGYWGWDPVENAGLLPWLVATGLLHGISMQERGRGFAGWNVLLAVLAYLLVIYGTWVARSGAVQSVHAYARSALGSAYLAFLGLAAAFPLALLPRRIGILRSARPAGDPAWRDWVSLMTLVLLLTVTLSILIGSLLPTLSEALGAQRVEVGAAWFEGVTDPQLLLLVALLGICPLLATAGRSRGRLAASGAGLLALPLALAAVGCREPLSLLAAAAAGLALGSAVGEGVSDASARASSADHRRLGALRAALSITGARAGGRLAHVGVVCIAVGVIGTRPVGAEATLALSRGVSTTWNGYTLTYEGLATERYSDYVAQRAVVSVIADERPVTRLQPETQVYLSVGRSVSVPAVQSSLGEDLYVVLAGRSSEESEVTLRVMRIPLIAWLWIGGVLLLLGGCLALLPGGARKERAADRAPCGAKRPA